MTKTVKINSLPIGSTFKLSSGKTGTLIQLNNMGAMVQYQERATYISVKHFSRSFRINRAIMGL